MKMEKETKLARRVIEKVVAARPYHIGGEFAGLLIKFNEDERKYLLLMLKEGIKEWEKVKSKSQPKKKNGSAPSEKKSSE